MSHIAPPPSRFARLGFVLLLVALPLLAWTAVEYQRHAAREEADRLAEYCAPTGSGAFSLKLACIPRRDQ